MNKNLLFYLNSAEEMIKKDSKLGAEEALEMAKNVMIKENIQSERYYYLKEKLNKMNK